MSIKENPIYLREKTELSPQQTYFEKQNYLSDELSEKPTDLFEKKKDLSEEEEKTEKAKAKRFVKIKKQQLV